MNYLIICRHGGGYNIHAELDGENLERVYYVGINKRDAVKKYRRAHGLTYKHFVIIDY